MSKLRELRDLLADESKWPKDFVWDYGDPRRCAIGLAIRAGIATSGSLSSRRAFGITCQQDEDIFFRAHAFNKGTNFDEIQPKHVLKVMDRVLEEIENA